LHPDFLIIGAGVIGYTTARELIAHGAKVSILDRGEAGRESSWAGGGILSPLLSWDYPETVTQLSEWSRGLYPELIQELFAKTGIDPEYRVSGMLVLPPFDAEKAQSWCAAYKVRLETADSRAVVPRLARPKPALWLPEVAQVRSPRLLRALRRALELDGAIIYENARVIALRIAGDKVESVETTRGAYQAGQVIVCAGAWSRELLGSLALGLAVRPVRGQMLLFKLAPGVLRPVILQNDFYLIPRDDGHILAGSSVEEAGFDKSTTLGVRGALLEQAQSLLSELAENALVAHWAGLRPGSPANIPVIARHPHVPNLYVNSGHYRYGVTMAPGSARLLLNLILERPQQIDAESYRWPMTAATLR
jgi:glycine oxidase